MAIETICSGCGQKLSVGDEFAGRRARCPSCRQIYTVPILPDGGNSQEQPVADAASEVAPAGYASIGEESPAESDSHPGLAETTAGTGSQISASSDPTDSTAPEFYMQTADGSQYGPVDRANLNRWFSEGRVGDGYQIRQNDGPWQPAESFRPQPVQQNPYAENYGTAQAAQAQTRYAKSDSSGLVLTMGILSWVCVFMCPFIGWIPGLVAWICGRTALRDIANGVADPSNLSMVQVGYYLGMIHVVLTLLAVIGMFGFFGLAVVLENL